MSITTKEICYATNKRLCVSRIDGQFKRLITGERALIDGAVIGYSNGKLECMSPGMWARRIRLINHSDAIRRRSRERERESTAASPPETVRL